MPDRAHCVYYGRVRGEMPDDTEQTEQATDQEEGQPTNEANETETEPFDPERAKATIEAQRKAEKQAKKEAADYKKRLEELEQKEREREEAEKTELERAQARAEAAEKAAQEASERIRQTETRASIVMEANKLNIIDPEAAYTLLDKDDLEYDDSGRPTNVSEALESLIKAKPYLVKQEETPKTGVPSSPKTSNGKTRDDTIAQTKEELQRSGVYRL